MRLHLAEGEIPQQREDLVWASTLQVSKKRKRKEEKLRSIPRGCSSPSSALLPTEELTRKHTEMHKDIKKHTRAYKWSTLQRSVQWSLLG